MINIYQEGEFGNLISLCRQLSAVLAGIEVDISLEDSLPKSAKIDFMRELSNQIEDVTEAIRRTKDTL